MKSASEKADVIMTVASKYMELTDEAREYIIGFIAGYEAAKAAFKAEQQGA